MLDRVVSGVMLKIEKESLPSWLFECEQPDGFRAHL
jgi:hypothetical protein